MKTFKQMLFVAALIAAVFPATGWAQRSIWQDRQADRSISVEFIKPQFDNGPDGLQLDPTFMTGAYMVTGAFKLRNGSNLVIDLPISHYGYDYQFGDFSYDNSETSVGNPYLGLEFRPREKSFFELGVRLPVVDGDDFGWTAGFASDHERIEAYFPNALSVIGAGNYLPKIGENMTLRLRGGLSGIILTESEDGQDSFESVATYSGQFWYNSGNTNIGAGLSGRWVLTAEDASLAEASTLALGLSANTRFGAFRPGLTFVLPLDDDLKQVLDSEIALSLMFIMR